MNWTTDKPTEAGWTGCGDCGMPCASSEYHPYAACLMFKHCRNSETVRANLQAVRQQGRVAGLREAVKQLHEGVRLAQSREVADALSGHAYTLDRIAQQAQEGVVGDGN